MNRDLLAKTGKVILFLLCVVILVVVYASVVIGRWSSNSSLSSMMDRGETGIGTGMMDVSQQLGSPLAKSSVAVGMPNPGMMNSDQVNVSNAGSLSAPESLRTSTDTPVSIDQKVIKTGSLSLRVDNADWSVGEITKTVNGLSGSVASSNFSNNGRGAKSGVITVRVPAVKFDEAFTKLKQLGGTVVSEAVSGQDVTEQMIDIEARIKNKQAEEEAYANILKVQTQKVADILEVTRALSQVRGEIESLQGQLKYLNSQADMSTIDISLSEEPQIGKVDTTWRPLQVVKTSINTLLQNLQGLVDFLIRFVIVALPILLIVFGLLGWLLWWAVKKLARLLNGNQQ
ncbi:MAG: DUF4349 domain-containing protein [Candidatus Moraniibacteriota bacterium]